MLDQILESAAAAIEPVATCQGIAAGARVLTLRGAVAIEDLQTGERIITRNGARTLRALHQEIVADLDVVCIAPGALGHDRPEVAMMLPADQTLFLRDWRAQAIYGAREAMIPASRLVDGEFLRADHVAELRLFRLVFDNPEIIYVDGVELACAPITR